MVRVLVKVTVEDFDRFWSVFETKGAELRKAHGSQEAQVFRVADQPNEVRILFRWESAERMQEFLANPTVRETMRSGGTMAPPEVTFLEEAGVLPN